MSDVRIEFTLSMPSRGSWDQRWSGEERRYAIVRSVSKERAEELLKSPAYWTHGWSDGWRAGISARRMGPGERAKKSDGFCGYEWMVKNIIAHGRTEDPEGGTP